MTYDARGVNNELLNQVHHLMRMFLESAVRHCGRIQMRHTCDNAVKATIADPCPKLDDGEIGEEMDCHNSIEGKC